MWVVTLCMPKTSSHILNMHSYIQQVPVPLVKGGKGRVWMCIKQRKMWIATIESTILTLSHSAQREQDSRMCWNLCLEFKETKCKKTTIPSKHHNSLYLKRSRNNNASLCIQMHTYTNTQANTHISGVFSKTVSVISFICVSWVPVFLH